MLIFNADPFQHVTPLKDSILMSFIQLYNLKEYFPKYKIGGISESLAREEVLVENGSILTSVKSHHVQEFDELPIPQDVTSPERCWFTHLLGARIQAVCFISSHAWEGHIELNSANNWMNKKMSLPLKLLERNTALPTP